LYLNKNEKGNEVVHYLLAKNAENDYKKA
jgi:hypothetical protein